jgi:hypothetical protein
VVVVMAAPVVGAVAVALRSHHSPSQMTTCPSEPATRD